MSDLYRDFIDQKADQIITDLGGTITPAPANAELYRDFLDRKFDDVINSIDNVKIKSFKYTGDGQNTKTIIFPIKPTFILSISGNTLASYITNILPFNYGTPSITSIISASGIAPVTRQIDVTYNDNEITLNGQSGNICNINNKEYTVYYI